MEFQLLFLEEALNDWQIERTERFLRRTLEKFDAMSVGDFCDYVVGHPGDPRPYTYVFDLLRDDKRRNDIIDFFQERGLVGDELYAD